MRKLKNYSVSVKYPCRVVRSQKRAAWLAYDMDKRYPQFEHSIEPIISEL